MKAFTLIEALCCVAVVLILGGLAWQAIAGPGQPTVLKEQAVGAPGSIEASQTRTIMKVSHYQLEKFVTDMPTDVRLVQAIPVFSGSGKTLDISHYLCITEKVTK
jgi:type IV secretory pathway TrbF-like protein